MLRTLKPCRWLAAAVGAIGLVCCSTALAGKPPAPAYTFVCLDKVGYVAASASDINDAGVVVGLVDKEQGGGAHQYFPACWTRDGAQWVLHTLDPINTFLSSGASGVNEVGQIVGGGDDSDGKHRACYWANWSASPVVLPSFNEGDDTTHAEAINGDGVICGAANRAVVRRDGDGNPVLDQYGNWIYDYVNRALVWRLSATGVSDPIELPAPEFAGAAAINENDDAGFAEVVGSFYDSAETATAAVRWTVKSEENGSLRAFVGEVLDLTARAHGVNNLGAVCGDDLSVNAWEAVVWTADSTKVLARAKWFYGAHALDINDNGVIVGYGDYHKMYSGGPQAVMWRSTTAPMVRLNDLVYPGSPITGMYIANAVNNAGQIVGLGWDGSSNAAFLAIPSSADASRMACAAREFVSLQPARLPSCFLVAAYYGFTVETPADQVCGEIGNWQSAGLRRGGITRPRPHSVQHIPNIPIWTGPAVTSAGLRPRSGEHLL